MVTGSCASLPAIEQSRTNPGIVLPPVWMTVPDPWLAVPVIEGFRTTSWLVVPRIERTLSEIERSLPHVY
jgi:hypothetical protein